MNEIVVVGGGFAGLWAALSAAAENDRHGGDIKVTLVSRDAYLTMRPRLYEKNPQDLRVALRPVVEPLAIELVEAKVVALDLKGRGVVGTGSNGGTLRLGYDRLIVATGSVLHAPPVPGAEDHAWTIDSYAGAVALDDHLRRVMKAPDRPGQGCVVIVGAGMTGIELATEMRHRLETHGDAAAAAAVRVVLVEQAGVVGPDLGDAPRPFIEDALRAAGVETRLGVRVAGIEASGVVLSSGERIETATTVVTTGLRASPLAAELPADRDELGRIPVDATLRVKGVAEVFAAGDIARAYVDDDRLALMSCQHSITMGKFAGYNAARDLLGLPLTPYRQSRYVTCIDLGRAGALFTMGWDRQVQQTGAEAKRTKRTIVTETIYPPTEDRAAIMAAARLDV